ncbi:MAG: hypothetical protein V4550_18365 [Gemmatimonadota bacterium]
MSDEQDENPKKDKESDFDRDLKKSPLSPVNEDLWKFLTDLFEGEGDFPERIEARVVKGRNKDQYGKQIKQYIFKSGSTKPSPERLVMMCNEVIHRARIETDMVQKEMVFIVGAMHHGRSDDYFEQMSLTVKPRKNYRRGENGEHDGEDDEEVPFAQRYNLAMLGHHNQLFSLLGGMVEGLLDRSDRQASYAYAQLEKAQAKNIELLEMNMRLAMAEDERADKREARKMWRDNIGKGLDMAWSVVPPMLSSFKGPNASANWQPGTASIEAMTVGEFFKKQDEGGKLTVEQFEVIFGKLPALEGGALTTEQGLLLARVASKELNPDNLDALLSGGPLEILQAQVMKILQSGIPIEFLAPLKMLLDVRMARRQQQQPKGE